MYDIVHASQALDLLLFINKAFSIRTAKTDFTCVKKKKMKIHRTDNLI